MFTGRRFDIETGLYYYRARYYNQHIGRFMQTDPVGYGYGYCGNNPLGRIDPSGLVPIEIKEEIPIECVPDGMNRGNAKPLTAPVAPSSYSMPATAPAQSRPKPPAAAPPSALSLTYSPVAWSVARKLIGRR